MNDDVDSGTVPIRSTGARIGVTALNLIQPGLGLVRLGSWRIGATLIALPPTLLLAFFVVFAVALTQSFAALVIGVSTLLLAILAVYLIALALTWRRSATPKMPSPWWSRWYALVAIVILGNLAAEFAVDRAHGLYKPFYLPTESMAPTLGKLDRIIADMRGGREPAVGDVVLIRAGEYTYIKRVIGLPGDRIAMTADVPIINGVSAHVRKSGLTRFPGADGYGEARIVHEQLPREVGSHDVAIEQPGPYGEMTERVVPPGHVFVLGDNRERSADSRLSTADYGLGMVPISDIVGQPLYIFWSHAGGRVGQRVSH